MNNDVLRVDDIIGEIETNLEPLARQSEQARVFLALREELKALETDLFVVQYEKNRDRVAQIRENDETMRQTEAQRAEREQRIREQEALVQDKMQLTEQLLDKAREQAREQAAAEQRVQGEANLLEQRLSYLQEQIVRLEEEEKDAAQRGRNTAGAGHDRA
ncbi:MAG: hypothetical protein ACLT0Y_07425 [Christensenellales bacterium]